ncbi:MAG: isoleucine--tRNA ligase [Spirochaetes bacterium]|nr:isoleucine--tRNA ligase [Spirochaetota bacterium]
MDYSKTLNLPKTEFSMKANLSQRESQFLDDWEKIKVYDRIQKKNSQKELFILHDGPPYANGHIHLGHALNKILKDIIIKMTNMKGVLSPYIPGWDCHGLPIELQVIKNLDEKTISKNDLRRKCREYALKFIEIQRKEFKRLGIFGDWENPYLTMSEEYEQTIVDAFGELLEKGYVYRGLKPVYWCISCQTALAEAEVEYSDHSSPSITVKFPLKKGDSEFKKIPVYWLIWTTTPWTLPANVAICAHPEHPYVAALVEVDHKKQWWILAESLLNNVLTALEGKVKLIEKKGLKASQLEKMTARHPFVDRDSKIVFDQFVAMDTGTGCVHIAPGHGHEDHIIGIQNKLPTISPVNEKGFFTKEVGVKSLEGKRVFEANQEIIKILKDKDLLVSYEKITHSYPHCWRCKEPVIFRSTYQWFLGVDHKNLRKKSLAEIKKVKWVPQWGEERLGNMLEVRPDWCLSRQRIWGVPIPAFYCKDCGETILTIKTINHFSRLVKEKGVDVWFTMTEKELLPENFTCPRCGKNEFKKEEDILDVWFDSGVSHISVLEKRKELKSPSDMYLEGSDQYRGWFQSSLLPSIALRDKAPYKIVLTHGFTLDSEGRAMHKSLGNVIAPEEIIKKYGADILRLWVASLDYRDDVRLGDEILNRLVESYRKIRNTLRFILGNINGFVIDAKFNFSDQETIDEFDKWALAKLIRFVQTIKKAYENYEFHIIYHQTVNFCAVTLSSLYFDVLKDRLYVEKAQSFKGKSSRHVIDLIFRVLTKMLAPILSFTAEDAWKIYLQQKNKKVSSIHLEDFEHLDIDLDKLKEVEEKWDKIFSLKEDINKALEKAKTKGLIGHTLEARVIILIKKDNLKKFLQDNRHLLKFSFIVSQVDLDTDKTGETYFEDEKWKIIVEKAEGKKCIRCWNYSSSVGKNKKHTELCDRCSTIVDEMDTA